MGTEEKKKNKKGEQITIDELICLKVNNACVCVLVLETCPPAPSHTHTFR